MQKQQTAHRTPETLVSFYENLIPDVTHVLTYSLSYTGHLPLITSPTRHPLFPASTLGPVPSPGLCILTFDILFFNGLSSLHDNRQPINGSSASPMFLQLASNHVTHFSCKTEIMFINCKPCMTCNRCRQHSKGVLRKNKQRSHSLRTLFPTVRIRNPRLQENRHHSSDKNAI